MKGPWVLLAAMSGTILLTSCAPFQPWSRAAAATPDEGKTAVEPELIALIKAHNERRAAEKLPALSRNDKLTAAAVRHARDMAAHKVLSHEGSDDSTAEERIQEAGYHGRALAENVAEGFESVNAVVEGWMNSPGHRANILGHFDEMGGAWAEAEDGTRYWSVEFGLSWPRLDAGTATAELLAGLNQARKKADKPPLKMQPKLQAAAQRLARENAERDDFASKEADKALFRQIVASGYRYRKLTMAELAGQPTPDDTLKAWLDARDQRANILGDFADVGLGYECSATGKPYWTAIFASPLEDR